MTWQPAQPPKTATLYIELRFATLLLYFGVIEVIFVFPLLYSIWRDSVLWARVDHTVDEDARREAPR